MHHLIYLIQKNKKYFHYTNCQPLWIKGNLSKGYKLNCQLLTNMDDEMNKEIDENEEDFNCWILDNI